MTVRIGVTTTTKRPCTHSHRRTHTRIHLCTRVKLGGNTGLFPASARSWGRGGLSLQV